MTRRTPEVIEHPYIHCLSIDYNIFTDNPEFIGDSRGFTECTIMFPKHIIGIIIGHRGYNIKRMMKKYNIHVQTKQEGSIFTDNVNYNIPVMWSNPLPCFIIFGKQENVRNMVKETINIIYNTKRFKVSRYNKNIKDIKDTKEIYNENHAKICNNRYDELMSFSKAELEKDIYNECNKYFCHVNAELSSKFIVSNYKQKTIAEWFLDYNNFVTLLNYIKFLIDTNEELTKENIVKVEEYDDALEDFSKTLEPKEQDIITYEDLQSIVKQTHNSHDIIENSSEKRTFDLTEDEIQEGDMFIFQNQLAFMT